MSALPAKPDHVSGRARNTLNWAGWKAMELGLLVAALHLVGVPAFYLIMAWVHWEPGPPAGWFDATLWAALPLLFAGPLLMTWGDKADQRRRRRHAELLGCPQCQEREDRRRQLLSAA